MASAQVRVQLSTRQADVQLPERTGPILVKTNFARLQLSSLVNNLIESTTPIPFNFLINGTFLRTSIDDFLTSHGISAETTLSVEYVRAQLPPTTQASFEHDDWVGAVDVLSNTSPACLWSETTVQSGHERIVSGSYDDVLRVWDMSGRMLASTSAVQNAGRIQHVLAAKFITPTSIASSSGSRLQLWQYEEGESSSGAPVSNASLTQTLELFGHTMGVNHISVHGPTQRMLSASDDRTAALWSTDATSSSLPPVPSHLMSLTQKLPANKRRKLSGPAPAIPTAPPAGPLQTLSGHTAPVTSVIFHPKDPTAAYTTSRDHAVRTWDLETGACVTSRSPLAHTPLTALCALPDLNLLAVGTVYDPIVLVDPRESSTSSGGRAVVLTLKGHRNDITCLAANPKSGFGLGSGSSDGTCRVWDVRNTKAPEASAAAGAGGGKVGGAVFKIPRKKFPKCEEIEGGQGVKVFDLCWDGEVGMVSASEDKTIQVDR